MPVSPWGKGYIHIAGMKNTRGKEEYVNRLLFGIEGARDCGLHCQSDVHSVHLFLACSECQVLIRRNTSDIIVAR